MTRKTLVSLLFAGSLIAGTFTGLTGFKGKEAEPTQNFTLLATSEVEAPQTQASGTITGVSEVAASVMPAVVSITNKSVQEVVDLFSMYGMYGYGRNGRGGTYTYETESCRGHNGSDPCGNNR